MSGQSNAGDSGTTQNAGAASGDAGNTGAQNGSQDQGTQATSAGTTGVGKFNFPYIPTGDEAARKTSNEAFGKLIPEPFKQEGWVNEILKNGDSKEHVAEFFNQFANLQKKIGEKPSGVVPPAADAPADAWKQFYKALGVPDNVDDYKLEPTKFEEADKELGNILNNSRPDAFMKELVAAAQQNGLTPKQVQGMLQAHDQLWLKHNRAVLEATVKSEQDADKVFDAEITKMFGDRKLHVLAENKKLLDQLIPADSPQRVWLNAQSSATLAGVAAILESFRQKYVREDGSSLKTAGATSGASPRSEAQELMKHPAYYNELHPQHNEIRQRISDLYKQDASLGRK